MLTHPRRFRQSDARRRGGHLSAHLDTLMSPEPTTTSTSTKGAVVAATRGTTSRSSHRSRGPGGRHRRRDPAGSGSRGTQRGDLFRVAVEGDLRLRRHGHQDRHHTRRRQPRGHRPARRRHRRRHLEQRVLRPRLAHSHGTDSLLYTRLQDIDESDTVTFSGGFIADEDDCVPQRSLTDEDNIADPDFHDEVHLHPHRLIPLVCLAAAGTGRGACDSDSRIRRTHVTAGTYARAGFIA